MTSQPSAMNPNVLSAHVRIEADVKKHEIDKDAEVRKIEVLAKLYRDLVSDGMTPQNAANAVALFCDSVGFRTVNKK